MKTINIKSLSLWLLALLSTVIAHAASLAPDSGQVGRELERQPILNAPGQAAPLQQPQRSSPSNMAVGLRIEVKTIHVTGNSAFEAVELEALVSDLIGGEHTLAELESGVARITAHYRAHGYLVARAFIPAQDIENGAVNIQVLEGSVGQVSISNQSRVSDASVKAQLEQIGTRNTLQSTPVNRALLLLADTPGVGGARASLLPGASVGTSDLLVELDSSKPYSAEVELDNYGNRYTGENRLGAALGLNSPFGIGDQITLRALASDQNMTYVRTAYQLPVGGDGLKLGVAYSDTSYTLGKEFAALTAHGSASSTSLYASYPFVRSQLTNLSGTLTYESKKLLDQTDAPATVADKQVELINLGFAGNHQDEFAGMGITSFDLSLVSGNLVMDANSLIIDGEAARTSGTFAKLNVNVNRVQRVGENTNLTMNFSGQQANKNLNSSEKFALGGASGVRAFPQGEGIGDEGWMVNVELLQNLTGQLQGVVFYDSGSVTVNHDSYVVGAVNTRDISGVGMGLNATIGWARLKTSIAWRTTGGQPQSVPSTVAANPMLWVQLTGQF